MSTNDEEYDIFVSYDELTGREYAEIIHKALKRRGYKVFVAHLERVERTGEYRGYIDRIILNCKTFILVNTYDALNRNEVIREFNQGFPNGNLTTRNLWIFKKNEEIVPYYTTKFNENTNVSISDQNQIPFGSTTELATHVLSNCDQKNFEKIEIAEPIKKKQSLSENQRKDYSELLQEKIFAQEFKKRGYEIDYERKIGNYLSADLILRKKNKWIICEFKTNAEKVSNKVFPQILKYKNELERIDKNISMELWLIGKGNFSDSLKKNAEKFNIKVIDDSNIHKILEKELVYLSVSKSIILYGESIKVRFRIDEIKHEPLKLKIKNEKGKIILEKSFEIKSMGWIEHEITARGNEWRGAGERFSIIVEYGEKSVLATIWRSDFGATIELDQKVYTWTDKVYVTLIAPDFSNNETEYVNISTNQNTILNYQLKQTGENTGIFTGEIRLSGLKKYFTKHEQYFKDFLGTTKGQGPTDGLISCDRSDAVQISFRLSEKEQIVANALVRWNIGEIQWLDAAYPVKVKGRIRVVDPDMNLNPDEIDIVEVKVWSDTDAIKKSLILSETNTSTGIFEGEINFDSNISNESTLRVSEGDTITAEYVDFTLPDPYRKEDKLDIAATSMIGTLVPPLQRIFVSNLKLIDENQNEVTQLTTRKSVYVRATLHNKQNRDQHYAFLVQVVDKNGVSTSLGTDSGILKSNEIKKPSIKWRPEYGGEFTLSTFVWESKDNPTALSPPLDKQIFVEGKTLDDLGFPRQLFAEPKEIDLDRKMVGIPKKENLVIIPLGSSVPGCEETGKCYIPNILEIKLNEEVIWENHDTAAHTITSGTPENGPDGEFDSSLFMSGVTFSHRFSKKGEYRYFDMTHPWQIGVIIVK